MLEALRTTMEVIVHAIASILTAAMLTLILNVILPHPDWDIICSYGNLPPKAAAECYQRAQDEWPI